MRRLPVPARYGLTTLLVLVSFAACRFIGDAVYENSLIVFFPAVILAAMVFDRGNGLYAVGLSAALSAYYLAEPRGQFTVAHSGHLIFLAIFIVSGGITATLIESLHRAIHDLSVAHADLRRIHEDLTRSHRDVLASERQKDLLLQELTHRTKNDLTLVSSLLRMQARLLPDSAAREILESAGERIRVLGSAHARLTRSAGGVIVDARAFLGGLCDDLRAAFMGARPVALLCEAESHLLSHPRAVAVGLIVHELVTNAMKHAFPGDRDGTVRVAFERRSDDYRLVVEDDGIGPAGVEAGTAKDGSSSGMGQRLVRTLTLQLRGRLETTSRSPGTICCVVFPVAETEHGS